MRSTRQTKYKFSDAPLFSYFYKINGLSILEAVTSICPDSALLYSVFRFNVMRTWPKSEVSKKPSHGWPADNNCNCNQIFM